MISQNRFFDIKISGLFCDIKKSIFDIIKSNLLYQEIYFVISQNRDFIVKRRLIELYPYAVFTQPRGVGDSTYC